MRAIRYYGAGDIRLDDIQEPVAGPGQVKIKVAWSGICGSDVHLFHKPISGVTPTATEPHPITGETLPIGMGHEFSGTIVQLGPEVDTSRYAVGQNVTMYSCKSSFTASASDDDIDSEPIVACRSPTCLCCSVPGTRNLCPNVWLIGMCGGGGGLAEYVAVPQELVHVLPPGTSLEVGAMMEPLAVAWHGVKKAKIQPGDKALILGAGPVGILVLKVLKLFGTSWVGISGRSAKRCELSRHHGASKVFDVANPVVDVAAETLRETGGRGADVVFDCGGSQATLDTALHAVRAGGLIMNLAGWTEKPAIDMQYMMLKEIILANSIGYADDHPEMLQAVARGDFSDLDSLITRRVPLEDLVEKGIKSLIYEKQEHVKILVHP